MGMKARPKRWRVEIVETATGKIEKSFTPVTSERIAEKLDDGVNINLNHERFHTRTVETRRAK